jgi:hypothetical protein
MFNKEKCYDLFKNAKLENKNGEKTRIYEHVSEEKFLKKKLTRNNLVYMH